MKLTCHIYNHVLDESCFHAARNLSRNNRHTRCKDCSRAMDRGRNRKVYKRSDNWGQKARLRKRRWAAANRDPVKESARRAVKVAIQNGILKPPDSCEHCGVSFTRIDGARGIQGHHFAGYDKPTTVRWLCPKCHASEHIAVKGNQ